jgi:hypothetical protein
MTIVCIPFYTDPHCFHNRVSIGSGGFGSQDLNVISVMDGKPWLSLWFRVAYYCTRKVFRLDNKSECIFLLIMVQTKNL